MTETPDPIDVEVGARIRIRRRLLSVSQEELASALKLTFQQVQKYEKGVNRVSASMLVKIAKRLDTTVAALVGEEDPVRRPTEIYQALAAPGGLEVLKAYAAIPDGASKLALLKLIVALAYGDRSAEEAA
jgi:transcriptional regulator with XRE-family HTH domain